MSRNGRAPHNETHVEPLVHLSAARQIEQERCALNDPTRLQALEGTQLLDTLPEESFDRWTRLCANVLNVPVSLVSLVGQDRQFFKSQRGLQEPWASARQTPLSHSFCQHVVTSGEPLVVEDALRAPLVANNRAIDDLGVMAYAGVPLRTREGHVLGSLCAIDTQPRAWSEAEIVFLRDVAAVVMTEIELRTSAGLLTQRAKEAEATLEVQRRLDRERAELMADVERERATLKAVTASMTDGLLVLDLDGTIRYANGRVGAAFGISSGTFIGRTVEDAHAEVAPRLEDPERALSQWRDASERAEQRPSFELTMLQPVRRDLCLHAFPVYAGTPSPTLAGDDGASAPVATGVIVRDITDERALRRAKDHLMAVVSHEIRMPLGSLVGFSELMLSHDYPDAQRKAFLTTMLEEGRRLTVLLDEFLEVQRLESGVQRMDYERVSALTLLQAALEVAGHEDDRPITLHVPESLPPVMADATRIQQVLLNLFSNARKYSPGGGEIEVHARDTGAPTGDASDAQSGGSPAGRMVEFSVRDRGLGIPQQALPRLFQQFYRVEQSDHRSIKGTGLGLAICKQIVLAHGGDIRVHSDGPGTGSTFTFTLPVAPPDSHHSGPAPRPAATPRVEAGSAMPCAPWDLSRSAHN